MTDWCLSINRTIYGEPVRRNLGEIEIKQAVSPGIREATGSSVSARTRVPCLAPTTWMLAIATISRARGLLCFRELYYTLSILILNSSAGISQNPISPRRNVQFEVTIELLGFLGATSSSSSHNYLGSPYFSCQCPEQPLAMQWLPKHLPRVNLSICIHPSGFRKATIMHLSRMYVTSLPRYKPPFRRQRGLRFDCYSLHKEIFLPHFGILMIRACGYTRKGKRKGIGGGCCVTYWQHVWQL
jgi:hypothetical protein